MATTHSPPYIFVGTAGENDREATFLQLKQTTANKSLCNDLCVLDVPTNLKFGSFDDLIRTVDELPKHDTLCESNIRKIQRQALEVNPKMEFTIMWQGKSISIDQYIRRFTWDNSKYPRSKYIKDNLDYLVQNVNKLDDSFRTKVAAWSDAKSKSSDITKKENVNLSQRELIDVITPNNTHEDDFLDTEHFQTCLIYVPRGSDNEWKAKYESLGKYVVPRSTKKFNVTDKDGGSLWRVIILKNHHNDLLNAAKDYKFVVRDFVYNKKKYLDYVETKTELETEKERQEAFIIRMCSSTFSELFISWMHLKAMRMFCESVLRYGVPPKFFAFALKPASESKIKKLRKELDSFFTANGFADIYSKVGKETLKKSSDANAINEEFYPYVSLSIQPFLS